MNRKLLVHHSVLVLDSLHTSAVRALPIKTEGDFDKQEVGYIEQKEEEQESKKGNGREPGETTINLDEEARVMREKTLKPKNESEEK